jgi:ATP-dependent helicase/nuclease subunit B
VLFAAKKSRQAGPQNPAQRIYTMPPGRAFLTALAEALLRGDLPVPGGRRPSPLELADFTLLLPTRRDIRALQDAFLKAAGGGAVLLPRIKLISDEGDELSSLSDAVEGDALEPQGTISKIERELTLTRLVLAWSERAVHGNGGAGARTAGQAVKLAKELARLMDAVEIEDVSLSNIAALVPDDLSEHWAQTLDFLRIVTETWPVHLRERGLISPAEHRKQIMLTEAARLKAAPPSAPVIVAGVTGTVPAATELMRVVTGLPNGALVLPAIDKTLDDESWDAIVPGHPEHPQFGLKKLLDALGLKRDDLLEVAGPASADAQRARWAFACEAMRPAATTERWHASATDAATTGHMAQALRGIAIIEAPSAQDEAEAIALILREAVQTPGRTAALVSPDRTLARRVSVRLQSWGLSVEDAAGQPFGKTLSGAFLDLVIEAAAQRFDPVALAALLKHPLCRLGLSAAELDLGRRTLELAVFRTPYCGDGLQGVVAGLDRTQHDTDGGSRRHRAARRLGAADWKAARELVRRLSKAFVPIEALLAKSAKIGLQALVRAHIATADALAADKDAGGASRIWYGEGEDAAKLFASILEPTTPFLPEMRAEDYPQFYRGLTADRNVQARGPNHPRLFIWGALEARLQQPDIAILGSLNEGTWPQAATPGPWLNRQMRQALGLPAPEERIGQAAHDFAALLGAERVYLTRAAKIDGVPTVPSRWLLRINALLAGIGHTARADEPWLEWAQQHTGLSSPARPVTAPEPRPPVPLRPRQLSVTTIEKWIANPYAVFAQRILRLEPLPELGGEPDAALRGQIVHAALSRFAQRFPEQLPADPRAELLAIAEAALAELIGSPRVAAFWKPRLARFAEWFAATEPERRAGMRKTLAEVEGAIVLAAPAGPFTLTARADRFDVGEDRIVITDYKTAGNLAPLASRAVSGEAPQLPLEAAIALEGGFARVPAARISQLRYISASGGEPPGQECPLKLDDVAAAAAAARAGLERLIGEFDREATPYRPLRRARFRYEYDDYAHLARVAEWSADTPEETE